MITIITGVPGAGKSLRAMFHLEKFAKEGRKIYTNIDGARYPEIPEGGWQATPEGSVVCIDEAQRLWSPVKPGTPAPDDVRAMETHRHSGHDLIIITQHPNLISHHVRRLAGRHEHLVRVGGYNRVGVIAKDAIIDINDKWAKKDCEKTTWKYPKSLFNQYQSATMHTVKKRLPQPIKIGLYVVPAFLIFIGFFFSKSFLFGGTAEASVEEPKIPEKPLETNSEVTRVSFARSEKVQDATIEEEKHTYRISGIAVWDFEKAKGTVLIEDETGNVERFGLAELECATFNKKNFTCVYDGQELRI